MARSDICAKRRALQARAKRLAKAEEKLEKSREAAAGRLADKARKLEAKHAAERARVQARQSREIERARDICPRRTRSSTYKKPKAAKAPGDVVRRKWPEVVTPAGSFPVRLRLVSVDDVITSHDPGTWQVDPRYPASTQERRYDRDANEQIKVTKIARQLKPDLLLAATPSALDGPPVVALDERGQLVALGGDGRTMAVRTAYNAGKGDRYAAALRKLLRRKKVPSRPILVRELVPPPERDEWARWSRDLNRPLGSGLDLTAQAVSLSRSLPSRVPALLAGRDLSTALRTGVGRDVLRELQLAGLVGAGERGLFEDEGLSEQGRALVRRALAGAALGSADLIDALPARIVDVVARSAPSLLEAAAIGGPDYDTRAALQAAAVDYADASKWRGGIDSWLTSPHLVQPETLRQPLGPVIMRSMIGGDLVAFADAWLSEARANPEGQEALFADPRTPEQIARDLLAAA